MALGERLRELRDKKGYTQRELAKILKIGSSTLAMYEVNKRQPDLETIAIFADFFGVSTDYLLGRHSQDKPTPEIAKLQHENGIEKIELVKDLSIDELKMLIEIGKTIRNKKPEN